mmetsp:Transcript_123444/g.344366  ORF Transcript_123444/g.344366 Transcript_123444/m.344366 type:complete len:109 (+) Transcript_123444:523-849(+)
MAAGHTNNEAIWCNNINPFSTAPLFAKLHWLSKRRSPMKYPKVTGVRALAANGGCEGSRFINGAASAQPKHLYIAEVAGSSNMPTNAKGVTKLWCSNIADFKAHVPRR